MSEPLLVGDKSLRLFFCGLLSMYIVKQEHVISQLKEHMDSVPPPKYAPNVALTVKYLEACNQLFERGILSHTGIWSGEKCDTLEYGKGYNFFTSWLDGWYVHALKCGLALKSNMSCQYLIH